MVSKKDAHHNHWKTFLKKEGFSKGEIEALEFLLHYKTAESHDRFLQGKDRIKKQKAMNDLVKKGIISKKRSGHITRYSLESIENFLYWIREMADENIQKIRTNSTEIINTLRKSLSGSIKSNVHFFEGVEGIKESYHHVLCHAKEEICSYFSVVETIQPKLQECIDQECFVERVKRKIFLRGITVQTPKTTYYKLKSADMLMELRTVSPTFFPLMNCEINLYENFMQCMVFDEKGGFAVIIEDKDIVRLQKALFELAWKFCDQGVHEELRLKMKTDDQPLQTLRHHTYITDNIETILENIESRRGKFQADLRERWPNSKAQYVTTKEGEHILKICDLEVMSDFETPYLNRLAEIATIHGGKILHIGYGLGIVDDYIQKQRSVRKIDALHIIEFHNEVYCHAKKWREEQKDKAKIFLHHGEWRDILGKLAKKKMQFDGVIYDGFPLEIDEICRDVVNFLYALIHMKLVKEKTGIITFYMDSVDGIGERFQRYLQLLGINEIQVKKVDIELPKRTIEYWKTPYFLAPLLTDIRYTQK